MAIAPLIDRLDDRLDAIAASLSAALPNRVIKRALMHYTDHSPAELAAGVVTLVSAGEKDYSRNLGMVARDGTQQILLIGHLKVAEDTTGMDIEAAELDLIEDLKTWCRQPLPGMALRLESIQHSRQLEHPYGWLVAYFDITSPRANTY